MLVFARQLKKFPIDRKRCSNSQENLKLRTAKAFTVKQQQSEQNVYETAYTKHCWFGRKNKGTEIALAMNILLTLAASKGGIDLYPQRGINL